MLLTLCKGSLTVLLFLLLFIAFKQLGSALARRRSARVRLSLNHEDRDCLKLLRSGRFYQHLNDLLEATRLIRSVNALLLLSAMLALAGMACGVLAFRSLRGVIVLTGILSSAPYLLLRLRLLSRQLKTRLEFLPAVEVFYQQYELSVHKNIRNVLQAAVTGDRLQYPMKPVFQHLHRNLTAGRDPDDALRIFALELGHRWAEYFADLLRMGIQEGIDLSGGWKGLIEDMRRSQLYDQKARNRLLEIRLASFSPVFFLALFIGVNFKLNAAGSYRFYVLDPSGRNMLLNALLLIFGSFIMGIYLSFKRM